MKRQVSFREWQEAPYAWPGGYAVVGEDKWGNPICPACSGKIEEWEFGSAFIYYEGPTLECVICGSEIPSEYGDPWATDPDE